MEQDYQQRVHAQIRQFQDISALSKLPPIYRYWNHTHIVPRLKQVFGVASVSEIYFRATAEAAARRKEQGRVAILYSLGAGDCQIEINIATRLAAADLRNVRLVCLELSAVRLARAQARAAEQGVGQLMSFEETDLNTWRAAAIGDVLIAHHTLHHVSDLEALYASAYDAMDHESVFLTADMIGRNGHQRWPEVLHWVRHLWKTMPDRYKFNFQFRRLHEEYLDWDCSKVGFEGIRAQEVLPLLLARFDSDAFLGFGGIIDPFVERGYGHNLDITNAADTGFIDFVEDLNQTMLEAGRTKPTMMIGAFCKRTGRREAFRNLAADFCVRRLNYSENSIEPDRPACRIAPRLVV